MKLIYYSLFMITFLFSCGKEESGPEEIVEIEKKPTASFKFALINENDPFTYKFENSSANFKETRWSFADDSTASIPSPTHTFLNTGSYVVKLVVLNGEGYWAQREETIQISASNLIQVNTQVLGNQKLKVTYSTPMRIETTKWLEGYDNSDPIISEDKEVELTFEPGTFKEIKLHLKTPQGSNAILDLLVSEFGLIRDVTNIDNIFTISHENGGGPDGDEGSKKLIDNNINTKVFLGGPGNNLTWQFEYFIPQLVNGYSMTSGNDAPERDPKRWKVEGSQDGKTWTIIDERADQAWETRRLSRTFTFTNKIEYKYYKFSMTELTSGTNFQMSEVRLLEIPQ